jgi:hypothetical protein
MGHRSKLKTFPNLQNSLVMARIYVGNLPLDMKSRDIDDLFYKCLPPPLHFLSPDLVAVPQLRAAVAGLLIVCFNGCAFPFVCSCTRWLARKVRTHR